MAEVIDINVSARVKGGPSVAFSESLDLDAYDKLEVTVAAGGSETIQLVPVATNAVQCLFIQSSQYDPNITYQVNGGGPNIALDSPQNFVGEGAVSALDAAAPSTLDFSNGLATDDVSIQILVGRTATP